MAATANSRDQPALERLAGLVERVTFHKGDSGFCVLRLKVKGERELVTLVGHTPTVTPGEYASASGTRVTDREHRRRFKAVFITISPPNTLTGIERYLGSGMVKGIGPVYAGRLVKAFGAGIFDVVEGTRERLREVEGFGKVRARRITSGWADQKVIRQNMVFLHGHRYSPGEKVIQIENNYNRDDQELSPCESFVQGLRKWVVDSISARAVAQPMGRACCRSISGAACLSGS